MILKILSNKDTVDTTSVSVSFTVTIVVYPCTKAITDPTYSSSYNYYIKSPSVADTITFVGLSNTNCLFTTTLTLSTGAAIDTTVFTYTSEVTLADSTINSLYSVTSTPNLAVNTSNIAK